MVHILVQLIEESSRWLYCLVTFHGYLRYLQQLTRLKQSRIENKEQKGPVVELIRRKHFVSFCATWCYWMKLRK